jgi:hypothetical protein
VNVIVFVQVPPAPLLGIEIFQYVNAVDAAPVDFATFKSRFVVVPESAVILPYAIPELAL